MPGVRPTFRTFLNRVQLPFLVGFGDPRKPRDVLHVLRGIIQKIICDGTDLSLRPRESWGSLEVPSRGESGKA